jgi:hypothetical protein
MLDTFLGVFNGLPVRTGGGAENALRISEIRLRIGINSSISRKSTSH